MKKLLKYAMLWHRFLGIGTCLFFGIWFVSGIVMMYARMPELLESARLDHLALLNVVDVRVSPQQAISGSTPLQRIILGMFEQRPVYRILGQDGKWLVIYADNGEHLQKMTPEKAIELASEFSHTPRSHLRWVRELTDVDQWTVYPSSRPYLPFELIASDDPAATRYYISGATGSVYLVTTRSERFWAWCGAIPHWWYIRGLRANTPLWRIVMIVAAAIGVIMSITGIVAGVLRYSPSKRYLFPGGKHTSLPHIGMKRWHYILGYSFGLFTFTWIFSGLMTMNPGHWSPGPEATLAEEQAFAGGPLHTSLFKVDAKTAFSILSGCTHPKEMELLMVNGRGYYLGRQDSRIMAMVSAGDERVPDCITQLPNREILAASRRLDAGRHIQAETLLNNYDLYYYDRHFIKPLPVERIQLDDSKKTLLYVNPRTGVIEARYTRESRLERWLYNGLHSLDFPYLYHHRPLWDFTVIILSIGGLILSGTGIVLSIQYLAKSLKMHRAV